MDNSIQMETAVIAMNKMMRGRYFNICTIDNVAKMLGISPERSTAYRTLHTLHCIDFADMTPNVRRAIPEMIAECFAQTDVFQFPVPGQASLPSPVIEVKIKPEEDAPVAKRGGFLSRWRS